MNQAELQRALEASVSVAREAGALIRRNLRSAKTVKSATSHDIKLELDVRCQQLIERRLRRVFREIPLLGEEGDHSGRDAALRWVVDPIDGTVNFAYGIPHACVSIALQERAGQSGRPDRSARPAGQPAYATLLGVVYDPFQDELWTALRGGRALLNGRPVRVSTRATLAEAIVSIGFAKSRSNLERALPYFIWLARRVRKIRMLGSAALGLTYVATGRLDAYIERGISLWDIAAGGLILECAGGVFWHEPTGRRLRYRMIASNGRLHKFLPVPK
ncbi:MAG: inositol monophosphatase family protein [Verrucomicrobiales bacterium]|nr:inositol monophosphatase family protein [Verrucomicrobiales bacterium]